MVGFADTVCSPSSVYATFNRLGSSDRGIVNAIGQGHRVKDVYSRAAQKWLDAQVGAPGGYVTPFRPGERVVFFGDSITHIGKYMLYLQLFENLRHPGSGVRLMNGGISGGSAGGGIARFESDILSKKPDRVFVMFGMNDVGRDCYASTTADEKTLSMRQSMLNSYMARESRIAELVKGAGKGLVMITPTPYDQYSDASAARFAACNEPGLAAAADIVRRIAVAKGAELVEFHRPLTRLIRENPDRELCGSDRVHPREEGNLLMAALVWNAMGQDGVFAEKRVSATNGRAKLRYAPKALPFPKCREYISDDELYPLTEKFNREIVAVDGLSDGYYALKADGRSLGAFSAAELKSGVNIALLDTPSQRRAQKALATMRELQVVGSELRGIVHMEIIAAGRKADVSDFVSTTNNLVSWIRELEAKRNPNLGYYRGQVMAYISSKIKEPELRKREEDLYRRMAEEATPVEYELAVEPATSVVFVDSERGDGAGDGSYARPFRTLECARDQIRRWRRSGAFPSEGAKVIVEGMFDYPDADKPFVLGKEDGGVSASSRVEYVAGPRGATLTGSYRLPLTGFRRVSDPAILACLRKSVRGKVLFCDLKSVGLKELNPLPSRFGSWADVRMELFAAGRSMPIARYPNSGWLTITNVIDRGVAPLDRSKGEWEFGVRGGTFSYDGDEPSRWDVSKGVWIHGYWCYDWASETLKVAKIDIEKRTITTEGVHAYGVGNVYKWEGKHNRRYYAYNMLEEIDAPGEWFVDRERRVLYFLPPEGLADDVFLSCGKGPAIIMANGVSNLTIRGFEFRNAGSAINMSSCSNVELDGLRVSWITGEALTLNPMRDSVLRNCNIHDIGGRGVYLKGGDRKSLTPSGDRVTGCEIFRCGRLQRTGGSCLTFDGCGMRIDHNYFHDVPYIAVRYHGNEHCFQYNEIECAMMEAGDGGGVYTGRDWGSQGNRVRYNFFHDFGSDGVALRKSQGLETGFEPFKGHVEVMGLYLDDCDSGEFVAHNLFHRAGWAMFNGGGRDNKWKGNLAISCTSAAEYDIRGLERARPGSGMNDGWDLLKKLQDMDYTNAPWATRYPWLVGVMGNDPKLPVGTEFVGNVALDCADFLHVRGDAVKVLKEKKGASGNISYGTPGKRDVDFFSAGTNAERTRIDYRRCQRMERMASTCPIGIQDSREFKSECPDFVRIPIERVGRQPSVSTGGVLEFLFHSVD